MAQNIGAKHPVKRMKGGRLQWRVGILLIVINGALGAGRPGERQQAAQKDQEEDCSTADDPAVGEGSTPEVVRRIRYRHELVSGFWSQSRHGWRELYRGRGGNESFANAECRMTNAEWKMGGRNREFILHFLFCICHSALFELRASHDDEKADLRSRRSAETESILRCDIDPWIDEDVTDVDKQVEGQQEDGVDHDCAEDEGLVAVFDAVDEMDSEAGDVENLFDDE